MAVRTKRSSEGEGLGSTSQRSRRRRYLIGGALALVALVLFVLVYFQPQKLLIDKRVDQALPAGMADQSPAATPGLGAPPSSPPSPGLSGRFQSRAHSTSGTARVLGMEDGSRILRLEDLRTDNGPDLRLYLSAASTGAAGSALDDDFVDLGALKGNLGNQNYQIPAGVDLDKYKTVVVWCRRFTVAFGVAPLAAA